MFGLYGDSGVPDILIVCNLMLLRDVGNGQVSILSQKRIVDSKGYKLTSCETRLSHEPSNKHRVFMRDFLQLRWTSRRDFVVWRGAAALLSLLQPFRFYRRRNAKCHNLDLSKALKTPKEM